MAMSVLIRDQESMCHEVNKMEWKNKNFALKISLK